MLKNVGVLLLAQIFVSFGGLTIPPLIPFIQPELKLNYTQVGSIMTFLYLAAMIMSLPAGWLTDRLGVKKMILLCQVIMGSFVVLFSFIESYWMALFCAFAMGLGYGMVNPPTTKGIMDLVEKEKRGFAMGVKQTGVPVGGALAAAVLPPIAIHFSWEFSLIVAGMVIILSGLLSHKVYLPRGEEVVFFREGAGEVSSVRREKTHQNKNIIFLGIGGAFCALVQIALVTYLILYLRDTKNFNLMLAAFCLTLVNIGGVLGRVFWGGLSDGLFKGSRKVVLKIIVSVMFLVSFILGLNLSLSITPLCFVLFVFGFSALGWNGVYHAFVGELVNKEMAGRAIGFTMMIVFIGNIFGPVLFGKILDATQSYSMGWFFLCGSMVGAFVLFSFVEEEGNRW